MYYCGIEVVKYKHEATVIDETGNHHLTAIGAVSRKLCNTIYTILKETSPCQPTPPRGKKVSNISEQ